MRLLGLTLVIVATSLSAFATDSGGNNNTNLARAAFLNDAYVKNEIAAAQPHYDVKIPQVVFLKESCGFAGCYSLYLVSAALMAPGVNAQSSSILAKVEILNDRRVTNVALLSPELKQALLE